MLRLVLSEVVSPVVMGCVIAILVAPLPFNDSSFIASVVSRHLSVARVTHGGVFYRLSIALEHGPLATEFVASIMWLRGSRT